MVEENEGVEESTSTMGTENPDFHELFLKKNYDSVKSFEENDDDDMPFKCRHIHSGLRSVRPEFYTCIHKLKSLYQMSQRQAEAAVIEVGNCLLERKVQFYNPEKPIDSNTLPAKSNSRRTELYIDAMALASIVEEVVGSRKVSVTYANNGSVMSGVGSYVVQSLTIDGVQRALPTLFIFIKTRVSLKELEIIMLRLLSASVGY